MAKDAYVLYVGDRDAQHGFSSQHNLEGAVRHPIVDAPDPNPGSNTSNGTTPRLKNRPPSQRSCCSDSPETLVRTDQNCSDDSKIRPSRRT